MNGKSVKQKIKFTVDLIHLCSQCIYVRLKLDDLTSKAAMKGDDIVQNSSMSGITAFAHQGYNNQMMNTSAQKNPKLKLRVEKVNR